MLLLPGASCSWTHTRLHFLCLTLVKLWSVSWSSCRRVELSECLTAAAAAVWALCRARSSCERPSHGSAAAWGGAAAGWRRGALHLHLQLHLVLFSHRVGLGGPGPALPPHRQDLHWPEDVLQEVSVLFSCPHTHTPLQLPPVVNEASSFRSSKAAAEWVCGSSVAQEVMWWAAKGKDLRCSPVETGHHTGAGEMT